MIIVILTKYLNSDKIIVCNRTILGGEKMDNEIKKHIKNYYDFWFKVNNLYENWAKKQDLTYNSLFILYTIKENEGFCTQKMICERLQLPKQTVNTVLNGFEEKGIVIRKVMEENKRNKAILFTKEGESYVNKIVEHLYEIEVKTMLKMTPKQRDAMDTINQIFVKNLEETMNKDEKLRESGEKV